MSASVYRYKILKYASKLDALEGGNYAKMVGGIFGFSDAEKQQKQKEKDEEKKKERQDKISEEITRYHKDTRYISSLSDSYLIDLFLEIRSDQKNTLVQYGLVKDGENKVEFKNSSLEVKPLNFSINCDYSDREVQRGLTEGSYETVRVPDCHKTAVTNFPFNLKLEELSEAVKDAYKHLENQSYAIFLRKKSHNRNDQFQILKLHDDKV